MKFNNTFNCIKSIILMFLLLSIFSCGWEVVPPTAKGKILTTSGYSPDVLEPGKYTLWGRDELILLQTNTATYAESVTVILSDKLTITVHVKFRGRISGTDSIINSMFNDISPGKDMIVQFTEVYNVYGKMAIRNKGKGFLNFLKRRRKIGIINPPMVTK